MIRAESFLILIAFIAVQAPLDRLLPPKRRISIGVTETMETFNPYGDSVSSCTAFGAGARLPRHL